MLITSGATREPLDPIRYLTNASTGRMGWALARAARRRGASVTVVSGPTSVPAPRGVKVVPVLTALEMRREVLARSGRADAVIAAAAVSDWRFESVARHKLKRAESALRVKLIPNPDIIAEVGRRRRGRRQVLVGFALETRDALASARGKLARKGLDLVVANGPAALGGRGSQVAIVNRLGQTRVLPAMSKDRVAGEVLREAEKFLEEPCATASGRSGVRPPAPVRDMRSSEAL